MLTERFYANLTLRLKNQAFASIDAARALDYDFCAYCFGRELSER